MRCWKDNREKPVIGLAGGIGSGKSVIARLFGSQGCGVVDSDADAHQVLQTSAVKAELRDWLGEGIFEGDGSVNRKAVAARVFSEEGELRRLNRIIHPRVASMREAWMRKYMAEPGIRAIVWDMPLLFEVGLNTECDVVVFVALSREKRLERVSRGRGWDERELDKRENLQFSLDKKAKLADYCIDNTGDEASSLAQVQQVLSQILPTAS